MAILTTPRGFHYPDSAQDPDVPRDINQLALDSDGQFISVSTFAALPTFGKVGRRAYVVNSGRVYLDIGSAWVPETSAPSAATPWVTVLQAGITWAAAEGTITKWFLVTGASGAVSGVGMTSAPPMFLYSASEEPVGFTAEWRVVVATLPNTAPGSGAVLRVGAGQFGNVTTSTAASVPAPTPDISTCFVSTGAMTFSSSGAAGGVAGPASTTSPTDGKPHGLILGVSGSYSANAFIAISASLQKRYK